LIKDGIIREADAREHIFQTREKRIFGVAIEKIYENDAFLKNNVPLPIFYCTEAIQKFLELEGIFRVSGTFSEMNELTDAFEAGKTPDLTKVDNPHSISGLYEKFFRELPQPVTTWGLYDDFMVAADKSVEHEQTEHLKSCLKKLPSSNLKLLSNFLVLMKKISRRSASNKMGEKNLGVVFGSIILAPKNLLITLADKKKLQNQNAVVEKLIANVYQLFPELKDQDELYAAVPPPLSGSPALTPVSTGGTQNSLLEVPPPLPVDVDDGIAPPLYAAPPFF